MWPCSALRRHTQLLYICPHDSYNQFSIDREVSYSSGYSELSSWLLGWEEVESLLALHSLLTERIIRRESGGMGAHSGVVVRVVEL